MYHIGLQVLRAKLRGFQAAGSTISSRISKAERERKNRLWDDKRRLGNHCRLHLIAYGLLRGVPYDRIERCAPENKPDPAKVLEIMQAHADWQQKRGLDLEKVKTLLASPVMAAGVPSPAPTPPSTLTKVAAPRRPLEKRA